MLSWQADWVAVRRKFSAPATTGNLNVVKINKLKAALTVCYIKWKGQGHKSIREPVFFSSLEVSKLTVSHLSFLSL